MDIHTCKYHVFISILWSPFDGDEMNCHLAQSIQARNEVERIANVKYQIIGAKDSNPIIGCVQDSLSGAYMMSMDENIPYEVVANLLCNTSSMSKNKLKKDVAVNGKMAFSYIIPDGINSMKKKGKDILFQIKNGELLEGVLDKSQLSTKKNSIIHYIWDKYGPTPTQKFIDDTQRLVLNYLLNKGLTIGLKDTIIPANLTSMITEMIHTKIISTNHTLTQYENENDKIRPDIGESLMIMDLNSISSNIGKMIMDVLDPNNGFNIMVSSGAKGSALNITQIAGCLGQVAIEGQRIKKKVAGRTLPIFHQNDDTPEARGFVVSSFLDGLKGHEFFFHTMGGREGLIDTAIKSVTGDTPIVIMEDNMIKRINIGDWIDNYLNVNTTAIEHYKERDMELLRLTNKVYIPTSDADGCVSWGEITAITRHDPGNQLYEIITQGGRKVIVTESKSLLVWNETINKFVHMSTPDVKVGDKVPVTMTLPFNEAIVSDSYNIVNDSIDNIKQYLTNYITNNSTYEDNNTIIHSTCDDDYTSILFMLNRLSIHCILNESNIIIPFILDVNTFNTVNQSCQSINDVVLDPIIQINKIDVSKYPKVYDLTVPSTLNFGLANGLHVVDTAETGYIQRKCVKFLEDLHVNYEGLIRTASGILVQYLFGDSGIDQQKQTQVKINLINMNNDMIREQFIFNDEESKTIEKKFKTPIKKFNDTIYEKMVSMRDRLRTIYFNATGNYKIIDDAFMLPINLLRITQEISSEDTMLVDPQYIVDRIEDLLTNYDDRFITMMKKDSILLKQDDQAYKFMLRLALYEYISPKRCLVEYMIGMKQFDSLIENIRISLSRALVEPGEMVGVVAAQSIGEPTSQMSVISSTKIQIMRVFKNTNEISLNTIKIGELCDTIINMNPTITYNTGHINSVETDLSSLNCDYYIIGVDKEEKTHWNKISYISRHPVNGDLMTVTTKSGRTATTTLSHSHLIRNNQTVEPIVGANLKVGMRIPVAKHIDNTFINDKVKIGNVEYILDHLFGWFIGAYLAEGNISNNTISISNISEQFINNTKAFGQIFNVNVTVRKSQGEYGPSTSTMFNHKELAQFMLQTMNTGSFVKVVPDFAFTAPDEFKAGLLQAYFDGDGNFQHDSTRKQIRVCSRSEQLVKGISLLLNYFDIFGSIKCNQAKGKPIYNLAMSAIYAPLYKRHINSLLHVEKLDYIVEYANREDAHILSDEIDKINGLGDVIAYCGYTLQLSGQSHTFGRWSKKESIGRRTLMKYIDIFENHLNVFKIEKELNILKQAANSNVIWDEIVGIKIYTPDQSDYVYDFTVPSNQTFMVDTGIIVHNTLNTKHFAGVAGKGSANTGVPRIKEIMSYSKSIKTPQMIVYFDDVYSSSKTDTNLIASYFKHLTIRELIESAEIFYCVEGNSTLSKMLDGDNTSNPFYINNMKDNIKTLPFVIRMKMNLEKMMDKETTLLDIKTKFITYWYKNFSNLKTVKKSLKDILVNVDKLAILSNNNNIIHIRFRLNESYYSMLTSFLNIVLDVITLKGIDNIANISQVLERRIVFNATGDTLVDKEHIAITDGININGIKMLKGINHARTKINDIETIYKNYGIEAARQIIINELINTFEAGGSGVNHAHISLLVDTMTYSGEIVSIDRHGMNKVDNDPISKASFEKTMEHFINAAIFSETDKMKSVSSRIALGRVIPGGTGAFDLLLDTEKLKNSEYIENETGGRTNFIPLGKEPIFEDIIRNGFAKNDFFIPN